MRGVKGSGPFAGRGSKTATPATAVAARSSGKSQTASNGQKAAGTAAAGRGRSKGRGTAAGHTRTRGSATATSGNQRAEKETTVTEIGGIKIETLTVPGRGGRPQQSEKFPFAQLDISEKKGDGSLVGPSFLIPETENADNILAAARKRHKGKTFMSRKMDGGVRIWRAK